MQRNLVTIIFFLGGMPPPPPPPSSNFGFKVVFSLLLVWKKKTYSYNEYDIVRG
jgi:hypothetical protein